MEISKHEHDSNCYGALQEGRIILRTSTAGGFTSSWAECDTCRAPMRKEDLGKTHVCKSGLICPYNELRWSVRNVE